MHKKIVTTVITFVVIIGLFFLASYFAKTYDTEIRSMVMSNGYAGAGMYVLLTTMSVVIAPISTLPLIPLAAGIWGWFIAGILSIIGWMLGAQIAFMLARVFGKPFIQRIISLDKLNEYESRIPEKNMFWTVVLLRIIRPVDILSYALGLFSKIRSFPFFMATLIGVTPFAFIFSYIGTLSSRLQVIIIIEVVAASLLFLLYKKSGLKRIFLVISIMSLSITAFSYQSELFVYLKNLESISTGMPFFTAGILIFLKTISAPLGFPGTPLTLLSGSLLGNFMGTITALVGNTLGATSAFLLSRYVFKEYVQTNIVSKYPLIKKYEQKIKDNALQTIILLRLIPLFPFNALNFILGVTNIPLKKYVIGSFVGMIPGTFLFVYFGGSLRMLSVSNILLAVAGIIGLTLIGKFYEKRLS